MDTKNKTVAYGRVSDVSQNEARQLLSFKEYGIDKENIYIDKQSGKDFNRKQYQIMKSTLKENDLLVIKSIDRLGRNYDQIMEEWRDITKNIKADVVVIDMPLLDTRKNKDLLGTFISDLVLQILSYVAEQERTFIKQRQSEGINAALENGVKFGRPIKTKKTLDEDPMFIKYYAQYKAKQINLCEFARLWGKCRNTVYNNIKVYESKK